MKIKQDIPWLKNKYLNKNIWLINKSDHYIFHYFKGSLAEKDINKIIENQERFYRKILEALRLENGRKIYYYLYPSREIKMQLMGDDGYGIAIWQEIENKKDYWESRKFEIHAIYNEKDKVIGGHEDSHLLSLSWGAAIYLFSEGLAEFLSEGWCGEDVDIWAKKNLLGNKLYPIRFLIDNKNWSKVDDMIVYPQAGSFVRYLINNYGMERFKESYKKLSRKNNVKENINIIEKNYRKQLEELEREWKCYLEGK